MRAVPLALLVAGCGEAQLCLHVRWYFDADSDGFGDPGTVQIDCDQPLGFVADASDCNDGNPRINPGATETDCDDPIDYNCDGVLTFDDHDGDGADHCRDCDDADPFIFPGADERCNEIDDDCDGVVDESPWSDAPTWYADGDRDGAGDPDSPVEGCISPDGTVASGDDCDDDDATISPDALEVWYDGVDQDCAGDSDYDADGDGEDSDRHGGADCLDQDPGAHPGADERCNSLDDDCDGHIDENCTATDVLVQTSNTIYHLPLSGTAWSADLGVPELDGYSRDARGLCMVDDGRIAVLNGGSSPVLSLWDPVDDLWLTVEVESWALSRSMDYGAIGCLGAVVFAPAEGDETLLRIDLETGSVDGTSTMDVVGVTVGLDGLVYALEYDSGKIEAYNPDTLSRVRRTTTPQEGAVQPLINLGGAREVEAA